MAVTRADLAIRQRNATKARAAMATARKVLADDVATPVRAWLGELHALGFLLRAESEPPLEKTMRDAVQPSLEAVLSAIAAVPLDATDKIAFLDAAQLARKAAGELVPVVGPYVRRTVEAVAEQWADDDSPTAQRLRREAAELEALLGSGATDDPAALAEAAKRLPRLQGTLSSLVLAGAADRSAARAQIATGEYASVQPDAQLSITAAEPADAGRERVRSDHATATGALALTTGAPRAVALPSRGGWGSDGDRGAPVRARLRTLHPRRSGSSATTSTALPRSSSGFSPGPTPLT